MRKKKSCDNPLHAEGWVRRLAYEQRFDLPSKGVWRYEKKYRRLRRWCKEEKRSVVVNGSGRYIMLMMWGYWQLRYLNGPDAKPSKAFISLWEKPVDSEERTRELCDVWNANGGMPPNVPEWDEEIRREREQKSSLVHDTWRTCPCLICQAHRASLGSSSNEREKCVAN